MKLVTAVIKPHKLAEVRAALGSFGVTGLTTNEAHGFGRQRGEAEVYRGVQYQVDAVPKIRLEVLVRDTDVPDVIHVIAVAARTGRTGDGWIWVTCIEEMLRIRTGERGADAL